VAHLGPEACRRTSSAVSCARARPRPGDADVEAIHGEAHCGCSSDSRVRSCDDRDGHSRSISCSHKTNRPNLAGASPHPKVGRECRRPRLVCEAERSHKGADGWTSTAPGR
jgi:hypothetical protein